MLFTQRSEYLLSESVKSAENVVRQLTAGNAAVALSLRQLTLATLHQFRSDVVTRSVLHKRLARLFPACFRRASIQRLVFQNRQQTPDCKTHRVQILTALLTVLADSKYVST